MCHLVGTFLKISGQFLLRRITLIESATASHIADCTLRPTADKAILPLGSKCMDVELYIFKQCVTNPVLQFLTAARMSVLGFRPVPSNSKVMYNQTLQRMPVK
jgi:hypothetical protein